MQRFPSNIFRSSAAMLFFSAGLSACKPRTPMEKVEDAAHEAKQGMRRAKENVKDAVNR